MALTPGGPAGFCPQPLGKSSPEILGPQDLLPKMAPILQTRSRCGPCPSPRPERPRGGSYPPQSNARHTSIHPDGASAVGRALGRLHHLTDGPPQPPRGGGSPRPQPQMGGSEWSGQGHTVGTASPVQTRGSDTLSQAHRARTAGGPHALGLAAPGPPHAPVQPLARAGSLRPARGCDQGPPGAGLKRSLGTDGGKKREAARCLDDLWEPRGV